MSHIIIVTDTDGVRTHTNVDVDSINLPESAEVYDDSEDFEARLSELSD